MLHRNDQRKASSGLGHGLASYFVKQGVKVWGAARRSTSVPAGVEAVQLDVSDADAVLAAVRSVDDQCGGLDLVIANSGLGPATPGDAIEWSTLREMIDVNVRGSAATLIAVADRMAKRGRGHLVGMSSLAGTRGMPRY